MIKEIKIRNVRRFDDLTLNINSNNVILQGKNATGKTTVLESISLTSITKSHRTNNLKEIIKEDKIKNLLFQAYFNTLFKTTSAG